MFATDAYAPLIKKLEERSGKKYSANDASQTYVKAFRVVSDHLRAAGYLIADGVLPGNVERGYVVRRLIRRAVRYADTLGVPHGKLGDLTGVAEIGAEETRFRKTLERGMKELARFTAQGSLSAADAFQLFTTYGFPIELIAEEAGLKGIKQIDFEGFKELLKEHQNLSRAGSEQKFKGGLADTSEKTTRLHTAHHLLLKALQFVLGAHVKQRGSNITQERLRIDFSHGEKMTKEQIELVEHIVNEKIHENLPVIRTEIAREDAEKLGAEHEFGAKYPDKVSVYSIGPEGADIAAPEFEKAYSIEFCGGPHVTNTGELAKSGVFKIQKEEAVSAGVRRIKAVLQ